tara:strand:- start:1365 stop:1817 length:453 start_codon:yes stop_codon:yes gene_type:complete
MSWEAFARASGSGKMEIRKFIAAGSVLLLAGCGLPGGIAALTYTMDGLSYASSGKGMADHALSAAANKDCAMLRAVRGVDICASREGVEAATLMTMIDSRPATPGGTPVLPARTDGAPSGPAPEKIAKSDPDRETASPVSASETIYGYSR